MPNHHTHARKGIFISYARSDGEAVAHGLRERLEREGLGLRLWQDRSGLEGGRDWWLQITEALDHVEFMVLVITPNALRSEVVRKEWRYARHQGVCVYPVKGTADLDFPSLPRWMRDAHFYDLDAEWRKLVNDLNTRCVRQRVPFMVEELPDDFVPRPDVFAQLSGHLLDSHREEPIAITAALRGAGGYGKTTLARALCHDPSIQDAFDDGILWVTLGQNPTSLVGHVEDFIYMLSGERPGFTSLDAATARLGELLADRDILMVIDDVWNVSHLKPFMQGGRRCARLITTRNTDTLPPNARKVTVDAMREDEGAALLGSGLPGGNEGGLRAMSARLGDWPLLLRLANGMLRDRVQDIAQPLSDALSYLGKALERRGLTYLDAQNAVARDQAVALTINASIDCLTSEERTRYCELAVFPEDVDIPLATLGKLWGRTGGLDEFDTEDLCDRLFRLSLLLLFDPTTRHIRLHDVIRSFLIQSQRENMVTLHKHLLDAHCPPSAAEADGRGWHSLPDDEPYLWEYLAYHLIAAGLGGELVSTVKDLRFVAKKAYVRRTISVEMDLLSAERIAPDDSVVRSLRLSLAQSSHVLKRCASLNELGITLYSRLRHAGKLLPFTEGFMRTLTRPYLTSWLPLPDLPKPPLIRTLSGHENTVTDCAVSADSSFIVSSSSDGTLKVWDAKNGAERLTLRGHDAPVTACAIAPDASFIVSSSSDGTLKVWDVRSGAERLTLYGHAGPVNDCAVSPDGSFIVSASSDGTLKVWDARSGAERLTLRGHTSAVNRCAINKDGSLILSASLDGLAVWNARNGVRLRNLPYSGRANSDKDPAFTAFSKDGAYLIGFTKDFTLHLLDVVNEARRFTLPAMHGLGRQCAVSPDGTFVVTSSDDALRVWDVQSRSERIALLGHRYWVTSFTISPDNSFIVSASFDKTLKIWGVAGVTGPASSVHKSWVNACAFSQDGCLAISASWDRYIGVWDTDTGDLRYKIDTLHKDYLTSCTINRDGSVIVSASFDRTIKVWDAKRKAVRHVLSGHSAPVAACAISSNDSFIVSASWDKTLKVWDTRSGAELLTLRGHAGPVTACAFSPGDGFVVSASRDKTLKVWDTKNGAERLTLRGHAGHVNDCAVSPDGSFIVSASSDGTLRVWDARDGAERLTLRGHADKVTGCAVSPDGSLIASAALDRTLKVWDTARGDCLSTLHLDGRLSDCEWSPTADHLVAVGSGGVYFLQLER
jgi:WD40 repeat protein